MNARLMARSAFLAGSLLVAVASQARMIDASILLEKTANNRSITVKYDGAPAASVEMFVNKVSLLTRNLPGSDARGEVQLPLDTALIPDGDSEIEVRLMDKDGHVLGVQTTKIFIDRSGKGPVFLAGPAAGDTVKGFVEIKVGFRAEIKNAYVSFFVNDEFKALKNYPPYTYTFDSTKVTNGWHEVQAWAVDDANSTFRSEKVRIYVNNPGGLTARQPVIPALGAAPVPAKSVPQTPFTKPVPAPITPVDLQVGNGSTVEPGKVAAAPMPKGTLPPAPRAVRPDIAPSIEEPKPVAVTKPAPQIEFKPATVKAPPVEVKPVAPKIDVPKPVAVTKHAPEVNASVKPVEAAKPIEAAKPVDRPKTTTIPVDTVAMFKPAPIAMVRGVRLPSVRTFGIVLDGTKMEFDVPGRVKQGIPTAPVRYLFERKGIEVKWSQKDKVVTGKSADSDFWLQIGNPTAKVNGKEFSMESSPYLYRSRTFVPLSFIGEALDVEAVYDPASNHVMILSHKTVAKVEKKETLK